MSALFKSRLFAPALFATALFGAGEQVPVTPQVPSGGMIARGVQYAQRPAKHVKLSGKTWQEQDTYGYAGIKYDLIAQHKVFALGKTGQEQVSVGSIASTNLVNVYKTEQDITLVTKAVSLPNTKPLNAIAISDVPEVGFGNILGVYVSNASNLVIGLQETNQTQQSVGSITTKQASISADEVSTHYHHISIGSVHTAQSQESSGVLSVTQQVQSQVLLTTKAATYQQQASFGKIATNDDEMLQVLLALMMLDDEIT